MNEELNDDALNDEINATLEGIGRRFGKSRKQIRNLISTYNKELPALTPQRALYNYFRSVYRLRFLCRCRICVLMRFWETTPKLHST